MRIRSSRYPPLEHRVRIPNSKFQIPNYCLAILSDPFLNSPSHVSEPEYVPVIIPDVALEALPVSVALHAGVGSPEAPAANAIVSVIVVPDSVPVTVPLLLR